MARGYLERRFADPQVRVADDERARTNAIDGVVRDLDQARIEQGMSKAELARRTGKHAEFVRRLFTARQPNPTLDTVVAMAEALDLDIALHPRVGGDRRPLYAELASLTGAWVRAPYGDAPDWTQFRAFLDGLRRAPGDATAAIRGKPAPSGSAMVDTLLAGIAEKVADDSGSPRPGWTKDVPGLADEWCVPGTPAMVERRRRSTPPQLRARGLVLDEASLWRQSSA